jgi:phosphoserine phosphatase
MAVGLTGCIRMVVFDLDGVLVDIDSSWQALHRAFGVDNEANFQRHLRGEIDYREFMRSDIRLWGRLSAARLRGILDQVPLMPGARDVVDALHQRHVTTAIISSGIELLAARVQGELGIDHVFANRLITDGEGRLLGDGEAVVTLRNKGVVFERLCQAEALRPGDCAVVGDSRFDVPLFEKAGISIAFNAHDSVVVEAADVVLDGTDLRQILPWVLGGRGGKAVLSFRYASEAAARAIMGAVAPDNVPVPPGVAIRSSTRGVDAEARVACVKGVGTLLATLDDLLGHMQLAEQTIRVLGARS